MLKFWNLPLFSSFRLNKRERWENSSSCYQNSHMAAFCLNSKLTSLFLLFFQIASCFSGEAININFYSLSFCQRQGLESTTIRTRCDHANHYTTNAVKCWNSSEGCRIHRVGSRIPMKVDLGNNYVHEVENGNVVTICQGSLYIGKVICYYKLDEAV